MNETCDRCGPVVRRCIAASAPACSTCADIAEAGWGRRCSWSG